MGLSNIKTSGHTHKKVGVLLPELRTFLHEKAIIFGLAKTNQTIPPLNTCHLWTFLTSMVDTLLRFWIRRRGLYPHRLLTLNIMEFTRAHIRL